jgi:hypothetical protein
MQSGSAPTVSLPHMAPVRPNPVTTSSTNSWTPWRSSTDFIFTKYPAGGGNMPAETDIGSAMNAPTVSGPAASIACSSSAARRSE